MHPAIKVLHPVLVVLVIAVGLFMPVSMMLYFGMDINKNGLGPRLFYDSFSDRPRPAAVNIIGLTASQLLAIHALAGIFLGVALAPKQYISASIAGLAYGLLLCGGFLLYFGWRQGGGVVEILFPMTFALIVALQIFRALSNFNKK